MISIFTDWLDWSGRTGRGVFVIVTVIVLGLTVLATPELGLVRGESARTFVVIMSGLLTIPLTGFSVRRLHDMGRNGGWVVATFVPVAGLLVVIWMLFSKSRDDEYKASPRWLSRVGVFALCLFGLVFLSRLFWSPFWLPSGSMKPTLLVGDYVIIQRTKAAPEIGDVVVFRHPARPTEFIKRVVAVSGDEIQLKDGIVHLNGTAIPQEPNGKFIETFARQGPLGQLPICANASVALGAECEKYQFAETYPGSTAHNVLNIRDGFLDDTDVFVVPEDHFFVLGDNRDNSTDSRIPVSQGGIGFVPVENMIGKARYIVFSFSGQHAAMFWEWRKGRYLQAIQ